MLVLYIVGIVILLVLGIALLFGLLCYVHFCRLPEKLWCDQVFIQLDQVRQLCDRAMWLDHGTLTSIGDPARVVDEYLQNVSGGLRPSAAAEGGGPTPAGESPSAAPRDPNEEERWGSGEVVLKRVALTDSKGRELVALGPGAGATIDMEVEVRTPQDDFVFGVGIYHADGTCVYGTNTDLEGLAPERLDGARGLISVGMHVYYTFWKYAKLWEFNMLKRLGKPVPLPRVDVVEERWELPWLKRAE